MLMALLDLLDMALSSQECDLELEWEWELDLDQDFLPLSEEGSKDESVSFPVKMGLKRQEVFLVTIEGQHMAAVV